MSAQVLQIVEPVHSQVLLGRRLRILLESVEDTTVTEDELLHTK